VTRNTNIGPYGYYVWNEYDLNVLTRNNWRASLVPAAAVIPAPIAYVKVAAVKKLVVGFRNTRVWARRSYHTTTPPSPFARKGRGPVKFTLKKLECPRQA
jgi:hypothetical protein